MENMSVPTHVMNSHEVGGCRLIHVCMQFFVDIWFLNGSQCPAIETVDPLCQGLQEEPCFCTIEANGERWDIVDAELHLPGDGAVSPKGLPYEVHNSWWLDYNCNLSLLTVEPLMVTVEPRQLKELTDSMTSGSIWIRVGSEPPPTRISFIFTQLI